MTLFQQAIAAIIEYKTIANLRAAIEIENENSNRIAALNEAIRLAYLTPRPKLVSLEFERQYKISFIKSTELHLQAAKNELVEIEAAQQLVEGEV